MTETLNKFRRNYFFMSYFIYILRTSSNTLYIGQTNNLGKRLKEHKNKSNKSAKYVRYFDSVELVYSEKYRTRKEAMQREIELKKWTKIRKEALVGGGLKSSKKLFASDKVYIGQSKIINAGRGVYAGRDIKKDEIIEKCPVIDVPKHDMSNLKESVLVTYFFYFGKNRKQLLVALGFGSIYNHTYKPNATFKIKPKDQVIDFVALKDIKKDEEITVNYKHGNPKVKRPLWFEEGPLLK